MISLKFVPQGGWGLVLKPENDDHGFGVYTNYMSACEPLAIVASDNSRGALCHLDGPNRLQDLDALLNWICEDVVIDDNKKKFNVYTCSSENALTKDTFVSYLENENKYNFDFIKVDGTALSAGLYLGLGLGVLEDGRPFFDPEELTGDNYEKDDAFNQNSQGEQYNSYSEQSDDFYPSVTSLLTIHLNDLKGGGAITSIGGDYRRLDKIFEDTITAIYSFD